MQPQLPAFRYSMHGLLLQMQASQMQYLRNKAAATAASIQVQHGLLLPRQYFRNKAAATSASIKVLQGLLLKMQFSGTKQPPCNAASIQVQHELRLQMQYFRNKAAATASIQVECIAATHAIFQEQSSCQH
jgi:hypothetical protein